MTSDLILKATLTIDAFIDRAMNAPDDRYMDAGVFHLFWLESALVEEQMTRLEWDAYMDGRMAFAFFEEDAA